MSHAANLRSSQRAQELSSKKRKLSQDSTRPPTNGVNGILSDPSTSKISAKPTTDVKSLKERQSGSAGARIGHADGDVNPTSGAQDVVEISSGDSEDEDEGDSEYDGYGRNSWNRLHKPRHTEKPTLNGVKAAVADPDTAHDQVKSGAIDKEAQDEQSSVDEEPSFGDLLRARGGAYVDIAAQNEEEERLLAASDATAPARNPRRGLTVPNANSLGTVLSQALRTNDAEMLESCLQVSQLNSIRATIERLPSQQAGVLLQRLAERMHNRPGRAGPLMVWVQWTIVAHGGYIATQPTIMAPLKELRRVVHMRAGALPHVLALKGKLDMLEAQTQLRKNRATQNAQAQTGHSEGVIYIEGESSDDESDAEGREEGGEAHTRATATSKPSLHRDLTFESDEEADDIPIINGQNDMDLDEDESDESDDEDLIDDEAEEADSDEDMSDEEIEYDDVDGSEGSESEDEGPAAKKSRSNKR